MELPIIKNIYTRPMISLSEAKKNIEYLKLMIDIEEKRQADQNKEAVLHIL